VLGNARLSRPLPVDIRQGVTLEILGEGWSMGPVNDALKAYMVERQATSATTSVVTCANT
jgi:hypothetical protein